MTNQRRLVRVAAWALVCWVVIFWRLGYPSFWDPDEAHYAETSREMLAAREWLVPLYNDEPFFDKPVLFHWLQMAAFALLGPTELAARLVPALAAVALLGCTAWLGSALLAAESAELGTLMLAIVPAMFALSSYAILDMLFTAFLFGGASLVVVAALRERPALQYPGYGLIVLAVLTKGPVALALVGLAFALGLLLAPEARPKLLALHWFVGLVGILALSLPWFIWMWNRFGAAFIEGYVLRENVWLFSRPLYSKKLAYFFYLRVLVTGLLPWTPVLIGRIVDLVRGEPATTAERLLWAWVIAVTGFFTLSRFKLDHYLFPAAPALCLLTANAWEQVRPSEHPRRQLGTLLGIGGVGLTLVVLGALLAFSVPQLPLGVPRHALLMPLAMIGGGALFVGRLVARAGRPPRIPGSIAASLLIAYGVIIQVGFPAFERAKPVKEIARWVATTARPGDRVASYRLNRWNASWRFYVERHSQFLSTPEEVRAFFARADRGYCAMLRRDYDRLREEGLALKIVYEREGLFTTTGRGIRQPRRSGWRSFVVATAAGK